MSKKAVADLGDGLIVLGSLENDVSADFKSSRVHLHGDDLFRHLTLCLRQRRTSSARLLQTALCCL